jgi:hypothetical protein
MIGNFPIGTSNRWQNLGNKSPGEQFTQSYSSNAFSAYFNAQSSDNFYVDASFIRLSNLSLTYQLSANWVQKMHLQGFRIYIRGQNLFTITSYKGIDPETQSLSSLPPLKVITAGIKISL